MNTMIVVRTDILPDRSLHILLPENVPIGPANIVLMITPVQPDTPGPRGTAAELARSPLFGLWADRADIIDSVAYARQLRAQAERRSYE